MDTSTVAIIVVIIFALIAIFSFVVYQQRGEAEIKILGMSLKIRGSNETPQPKPAISAKDITSREGGLLADDSIGRGIEIEKVDVKDDVLLSSSQSSRKETAQNSNISHPHTLTAQALTAGGNITIQQFVGNQILPAQQLSFFLQQLGFENYQPSKFAASQFEAYSNIWKKLQALRLAGDNLWELASNENLYEFGEQLRQVRKLTLEDDIYLEDKHREELSDVLKHFGQFHFGKKRLIEIRTREELDTRTRMMEDFLQSEIQMQIQHNLTAKKQYEELLEKIRKSFKNKLSKI